MTWKSILGASVIFSQEKFSGGRAELCYQQWAHREQKRLWTKAAVLAVGFLPREILGEEAVNVQVWLKNSKRSPAAALLAKDSRPWIVQTMLFADLSAGDVSFGMKLIQELNSKKLTGASAALPEVWPMRAGMKCGEPLKQEEEIFCSYTKYSCSGTTAAADSRSKD